MRAERHNENFGWSYRWRKGENATSFVLFTGPVDVFTKGLEVSVRSFEISGDMLT